jgi:mRNA interferase RelE/StbE
MWKVEYKKRFLKELSKLPEDVQSQAEKIVFEDLINENPFDLGYLEQMRGYPGKNPYWPIQNRYHNR